MTDMTPKKPKRSLLERADQRFDFGGQLRRMDPGSAADGPIIDAQPAAPVTDPVATGPVPIVEPALSGDAAPSHPVPAPTPAPPAARAPGTRRFAPTAPLQSIDRQHLVDHGLLDPDGQVGALAEEFRIIKRQMLRAGASAPMGRRLLVTSSQPDEGKTFTSINLALSLAAESELSVLLVDADFARADVPRQLGIVPGKGLMDALDDPGLDIASCVIPTDVPRLAVLPAGQASTRDTELLASARMREILATLDADDPDRVIVFDSMPLLAASSAGVLATHCGQVLVVVRADVTREAALRDAIGLIGQHNGISLLLNRVRFTPEGRRFGSYYGEGG